VLIASVTRLPRTLLPVIAAALVAATSSVHAQEARGVSLESKKPFAAFSSSAERLRDSIVLKAKGSVGTRYKLGGTKPGSGLDCSGLVRYAMSMLDLALPRTAQKQAQFGKAVPKDVAALKPGDVLTFGRGKRISHVGIYVGDGKMIHASTSQRRVVETTITKRSPLIRQWKGVRRFVDANTAQLRDSILAMADSLR
jgi:cell wall-associated NlpC family hydrolase